MIASLVSALGVLPVLLQSWKAQPNHGNILMPIPRRT
jgi:hypothetical protein